MQELKASLAKNICFCFQSTWKLGKLFQKLLRSFPWQVSPKNLKPLTESRPFVHCQRVQHALDIFNTAGSYKYHFINTSQNIKRMPSKDGNAIQCLTPNGAFFSMRHKRYITGLVCSNVSFPYIPLACNGIIKNIKNLAGIEKLLCQGFPVHQLRLSHLSSAVPWMDLMSLFASIWPSLGGIQWTNAFEKMDLHFRNCILWVVTPTTWSPLQLLTLVPWQCAA